MSTNDIDLDVFDQEDEFPVPQHRKMLYQVIIVSLNQLTGATRRSVYPANSLAEAHRIERMTDLENSRDRIVTIVPDVIGYLRLHYPSSLGRLYGPE